jgi:tRNA (adenine37-N6)-methyltransferase
MTRKKSWTLRPIGYVHSNYHKPSDVPKGLGAKHPAEGIIEISKQYEKGLKDLEGFSHLFVLWLFHRAKRSSLTATPPCDNKSHGVFSTRSPQRPNPIGLTVVQLIKREGRLLHVRGVDMVNGTPVVDIKPYLSAIPERQLRRGWLEQAEKRAKKKGISR